MATAVAVAASPNHVDVRRPDQSHTVDTTEPPLPVNIVKAEPPHPLAVTKIEPGEPPLQSPTTPHSLPPTPTSSVGPESPMTRYAPQQLPSPGPMGAGHGQSQGIMPHGPAGLAGGPPLPHPFMHPQFQGYHPHHAMLAEAHGQMTDGSGPPPRMHYRPPHHGQFGGKVLCPTCNVVGKRCNFNKLVMTSKFYYYLLNICCWLNY